jgi:hypothetical protein
MEVKIMNWRAVFLSGVLATGLSLTFVSRVVADPPPWAGRWGASRDYDRNDPPYHGGHRGYRNDPQYSQLVNRINHDRAKIAEITPTGRHRKALQWFKEDLRDAERDMRNFRNQRTGGTYDSPGRYYEPTATYDPDYDRASSDRYGAESFDWSALVGSLLNPQR